MSDDLHDQIAASLSHKSTDELVEIWTTNDRAEWSDAAFGVIEAILKERLGTLPTQNQPILKDVEQKAASTVLETPTEEAGPSGYEPVFYQPRKVLELVRSLNRLVPIAVLVIAISGIPIVFSLGDIFFTIFIYSAFGVLIAWTIAIVMGLLIIAVECLIVLLLLKATAYILRILMEMEFNSRPVGANAKAVSQDEVAE